jgi:hypothetical protein
MRLSDLLSNIFQSLLSKKRAQKEGVKRIHWTEVHALCFRSVVENWREYKNWLDRDVSLLVSTTEKTFRRNIEF